MKKIIIVLIVILALVLIFTNVNAPKPINPVDTQDKVGQYLRDNISSIAPEEEVLGGKFYVTQVNFGADSTGTVQYEDGHNAFTSAFSYTVDSNGKVSITFASTTK